LKTDRKQKISSIRHFLTMRHTVCDAFAEMGLINTSPVPAFAVCIYWLASVSNQTHSFLRLSSAPRLPPWIVFPITPAI